MADPERRSWWRWWRWPVAIGVLAWLIGSNLNGVRELMAAGVLWRWIAVAAGLRFVGMLLGSARWNCLLKGQGILLPYPEVLRVFTTGFVCNFLLPGTVGGDVARAGMIAAASPDRRLRGAATVPLDRLLGFLAFIVIGAAAGLYQWREIPDGILRTSVVTLIVVAACGLCGLLTMLVVKFPFRRPEETPQVVVPEENAEGPSVSDSQASRRHALGHELLYGLALLRESRRSVLLAFVLAGIGHTCLVMTMYSCLKAFPAAGIPAGAVAHLWIVPSAEVPAALLPLPGGVGAREGTLALLYGGLSTESAEVRRYRDVGVVVAATSSTVSFSLAVLLAAWLTLTGGWPKRRGDAPE